MRISDWSSDVCSSDLVEDPAPVVEFRQIAAERRSQNRTDHDADAPHRHGRAVFLPGIAVEQHGLGQRHQRRPEDALRSEERRVGKVSVRVDLGGRGNLKKKKSTNKNTQTYHTN